MCPYNLLAFLTDYPKKGSTFSAQDHCIPKWAQKSRAWVEPRSSHWEYPKPDNLKTGVFYLYRPHLRITELPEFCITAFPFLAGSTWHDQLRLLQGLVVPWGKVWVRSILPLKEALQEKWPALSRCSYREQRRRACDKSQGWLFVQPLAYCWYQRFNQDVGKSTREVSQWMH